MTKPLDPKVKAALAELAAEAKTLSTSIAKTAKLVESADTAMLALDKQAKV